MSTRAQICVKSKRSKVYLYQHYDGYNIGEYLQKALKKKSAWSDASYLARIIFDTMTEDYHGEEYGYGISSSPFDNIAYDLVVNTDHQTVGNKDKHLSFTEFCELSEEELDEFCQHL